MLSSGVAARLHAIENPPAARERVSQRTLLLTAHPAAGVRHLALAAPPSRATSAGVGPSFDDLAVLKGTCARPLIYTGSTTPPCGVLAAGAGQNWTGPARVRPGWPS